MLEKIKSIYFLRILINNLNHVKLLKLFKINNKIRNILNINLIDYKIISGKYIKGNRNCYAKEYDSYNNALIFEGDFIEWKKMVMEKY